MIQLFFDIETIPDGDTPTRDEIKIDSRLKDPDKIEIAYERGIDETYRKRSLIPHKGRILCIGGILDFPEKDDVKFLVYGDTAEEVILNYYKVLTSHLKPKELHEIEYVGFNIIEFDMKWLYLHTMKYAPQYTMSIPGRGHRMIDLMKVFTYGSYKDYVSMKDACEFFNIKSKSKGINGSMVYDLHLEGKDDLIYDYCMEDVEETRQLYNAMFK